MLSKKSKIEQLSKSRERRCLPAAASASVCRAYEALWSPSCDSTWSLTSAAEKFSSPARKTFFDSIGHLETYAAQQKTTAIRKFAGILREYHTSQVTGDAVGGQTYRLEFAKYEIQYKVCGLSASELYEQFEVALNNGDLELPDQAKLIQQLVLLINKTGKITHPAAEHDDWANAAAGAVAISRHRLTHISESVKRWAAIPQQIGGRLAQHWWASACLANEWMGRCPAGV
jgi:hypothetical protein